MQAIVKFYSDGKEIDIQASVKAMIEASQAPFSVDEITNALHDAAPHDEICADVEWLRGQVRRLVARLFSNSMQSASNFLCDELPDGRYVRHGVKVESEGIQETLVSIQPHGSHFNVRCLPAGKDELDGNYCSSEQEAKSWVAKRYTSYRLVDISEVIDAYRARVARSGISFEDRSRMWK
jgi:hypothetical protein